MNALKQQQRAKNVQEKLKNWSNPQECDPPVATAHQASDHPAQMSLPFCNKQKKQHAVWVKLCEEFGPQQPEKNFP